MCVCVYKRYRNNIVARFEVAAISMDLDAPPRETIPRQLFLEINQKYKYDVGFRWRIVIAPTRFCRMTFSRY